MGGAVVTFGATYVPDNFSNRFISDTRSCSFYILHLQILRLFYKIYKFLSSLQPERITAAHANLESGS